MFKQVSARIAAQQQASLFEGDADDFQLVAQDKKGQDIPAAPAAVAQTAGKAIEDAYPWGYRPGDSQP